MCMCINGIFHLNYAKTHFSSSALIFFVALCSRAIHFGGARWMHHCIIYMHWLRFAVKSILLFQSSIILFILIGNDWNRNERHRIFATLLPLLILWILLLLARRWVLNWLASISEREKRAPRHREQRRKKNQFMQNRFRTQTTHTAHTHGSIIVAIVPLWSMHA